METSSKRTVVGVARESVSIGMAEGWRGEAAPRGLAGDVLGALRVPASRVETSGSCDGTAGEGVAVEGPMP